MEKEIVAKENIKQDILPLLYRQLLKNLIAFAIVFLLLLWIKSFDFSPAYSNIVFGISVILDAYMIIEIALSVYRILNVKKGKFLVSKSTVLKKKNLRLPSGVLAYGFRPYTLIFTKNKRFEILGMPYNTDKGYRYYKWSKNRSCSSAQLFEKTEIYDVFNTVNVGKKIVMVYNTEFFELEEAMK